MPDAQRPFEAGAAPAVRGEEAGEGPPVVLLHGLTATRRYVLHGSRALERAGHTVIAYDARGHGESDPAPEGQGYGYPAMTGDLEQVLATTVGDRSYVLAGHSMGAHTAVAYALGRPRPGLAGLVIAGPVYAGEIAEEGLAYWDGLAAGLEQGGIERFLAHLDAHSGTVEEEWRETVLRFTRERMERHRDLSAVAAALREVPRSRPFDSLAELESLDVPALVVASHDGADPGHPRAVAEAYAEQLPQSQLVGEDEGESPLAWQGGRLSREVAAFCGRIAFTG
jgi:pimeloyl-ACP methyl ester carboxylesterase